VAPAYPICSVAVSHYILQVAKKYLKLSKKNLQLSKNFFKVSKYIRCAQANKMDTQEHLKWLRRSI
jgi:hypothetical protein